MRRSGVVEWYLNLIADQIESEEELIEKKDLIQKVVDRLIYHVSTYADPIVCWNVIIFMKKLFAVLYFSFISFCEFEYFVRNIGGCKSYE